MTATAGAVLDTRDGPVAGIRAGAGDAFLGLPYAAAPTGSRRWAPPAPLSPWTEPRIAAAVGPAPPQPDRPIGRWFHGALAPTDEDCLTLNVWTPARDGGRRPVLVWLHGGGWAVGWSGAPVFDGARLAAALDAVVVTANYRLGSLGWLHHPALDPPHGNWGLLDQVAALRWVRDNIAGFGGDPGRVTLAGQSAGAGSVLHLLNAPAADGLFHRAIAQSPPLGELTVDAELGRRWALALAGELSSADGPPAGDAGLDVAALRAVPAGDVVAAHEALLATPAFRGTRGGAMPIAGGGSLPGDPRHAPGARPDVAVLIGTTADEATFLFRAAGRRVDPAAVPAIVAHLPDVRDASAALAIARERLAAAGRPDDDVAALCAAATEQLFAGPVTEWAAARAALGATVHRYRLEHPSPEPGLGAVHAIDVPLVFGSLDGEVGRRVAGDDATARAVSAAMTGAWAHFVHGEAPWRALPAEVAVLGGPGGPLRAEDAARAVG